MPGMCFPSRRSSLRHYKCERGQRCSLFPQHPKIRDVLVRGMLPAVFVIVGHALLGEPDHPFERAVALACCS